MSTTDQEQRLHEFLDDLATPYFRYVSARAQLQALVAEAPPASLTRLQHALDKLRGTMEEIQKLILTEFPLNSELHGTRTGRVTQTMHEAFDEQTGETLKS